MDALSKAKNELKNNIKRLILDLSKVEAFSGFITPEPKLDQIKECLIVLKYLENPTAPTLLKFIKKNTPEKTLEVSPSKSLKTTNDTTDESFTPPSIQKRQITIPYVSISKTK
ncbi:MAG: hypothetical protein ABI045_06895 [Flavobacteriales bacterium]